MKRLCRLSFLFIILFGISISVFQTVQAQENETNKITSTDKKKVKEILGDLIEAIEEQESNDYLELFHEKSPIYLLHYSELKETFSILSSYDLSYEIEDIKFIEQTGQDIKVEVDIIVRSQENEEYIDRRNSFEYIFRKKDDTLKIYDMSIRNIEALDKESKINIILGKKRLYYEDGSLAYEGLMENGSPNGEGIRYYKNGSIMYEGTFKDGQISGEGIFYDEIGHKIYEGKVENGRPSGLGTAYYLNGRVFYRGYWKEGVFHRRGKIYYENGQPMYMGEFSEGRATGTGKGYYESGKLHYEGDMRDDCSHGKGIEYYESGQIMYKGEFANGIPHGEGTKYDEDGNIIYNGIWKNGEISDNK